MKWWWRFLALYLIAIFAYCVWAAATTSNCGLCPADRESRKLGHTCYCLERAK